MESLRKGRSPTKSCEQSTNRNTSNVLADKLRISLRKAWEEISLQRGFYISSGFAEKKVMSFEDIINEQPIAALFGVGRTDG